VILWTRLVDTNDAASDRNLEVELAKSSDFGTQVFRRTDLLARAAHDGNVKVKVAGLDPYTTYYYRFVYQGTNHSPVGRTRTAPAPESEQRVRFAFINCQDYIGRYFNTLADLADREADTLDFVVHLGDAVYETTGDPLFQTTGASRTVRFGDTNGAISLGSGSAAFMAANTLDNYRDLYRTYRSDRTLQRVFELFPVVAIWDDHEFSDDGFGDHATYRDGLRNEQDGDRKRRAEQAFFEFMPVDLGMDTNGVLIGAGDLYPNTRLYRDLRFGKFLHLLMTDTRTFRPDHLIPEDAFPGAVVADEPMLSGILGPAWTALRGSFDPYVDLELPASVNLKNSLTTIVTMALMREGFPPAEAPARATAMTRGKISARYANGLLAAAGVPPAFDAAALASLPRGLSFALLGKQDLFTSFGSRYAVARDAFQIYAQLVSASNPASQDLLGSAQRTWLESTLASSAASWKVVGSSVSFCPITFDFANPPIPLPPGFPEELRGKIQLNADHWDGFPQGRQSVLDLLAAHQATVISGDIHASFISRHAAAGGRVVPEFTGTSVSSENFREAIDNIVRGNPATAGLPGIDQLVAATDLLIIDAVKRLPESDLVGLNTSDHGYVVLEATAESLRAVYRHMPGGNVHVDMTGAASAAVRQALVQESSYAVTRAGPTLDVAAEPVTSTGFRLQVLHASDLEGGVDSIGNAPNFAAVAEKLAMAEPNTVILSAGDNYIPGPFFNAAGDPALRSTLDAVNEAYFGVTGLDIRETSGRADITIMNVVGFDASALGNHEFDAGTAAIREIVGTTFSGTGLGGVRWLGAQFPYLSANLDFSRDGSLNPIATSAILPNTAFRSTPADLAAAAAAPKIGAATLIARGGEVIGVVGATTPLLGQISSPGTTAVRNPGAGSNEMAPLASLLQPVINQLLERGVNKVVLVSHLQQLALERELVPLLRGVDIAIAGGSDSILANPGNPLRPGDAPVGSFPILTRNADGDPAYVVSTDGQYKYVGRLVVEFDPAGRLLTNSPALAMSGPYKTDDAGVEALWGDLTSPFAAGTRGAAVRQLTGGIQGIVTAKDGVVLGRSEVYLEGRRNVVRTEESNLGSLTADANLWMARLVDPTVVVSIKNGGGIRAEIGVVDGFTGELKPTAANPLAGKRAGEISQLDVENSLRFNNQLSLVTVTALELRNVLEHGVAASRDGATPGQFPQVSGVEFIYDPSRTAIRFDTNDNTTTAGERIRHLRVRGLAGEVNDTVVENGTVVGDPGRLFRLVTLNFLATRTTATPGLGGDGYPLAAYGRDRVDLVQVMTNAPGASTFAVAGSEQDALAEYLVAVHGTFPYLTSETLPTLDRRIASTVNAAPRFLSIEAKLGGTVLRVPSVAGRNYRLEYADSALGPWVALPNGQFAGDGNVREAADATASTAAGIRFYRIGEQR
jgi:phosphodiesterase/alkaline phosphatase D-like protein/2',3'-cyclic-nucleotide 2'-phosphodiesterase (5'-nucleotidase family)